MKVNGDIGFTIVGQSVDRVSLTLPQARFHPSEQQNPRGSSQDKVLNEPMHLPPKSFANRVVFALLMAAVTTSMVVLVTVLSQVGFSEHLFSLWLQTFVVDYLIVVPIILLFAPRLQRKLFRFTAGESVPTRASRIKFALVMAMSTVSVACFFGLLVNRGFNTEMLERFALVFPFAYVTAVPFVLLLAPRLQKRIDLILAG